MQEVTDYLSNKFKSVYEPVQNLSLDEGIIPWKGRLRFRTYNSDKVIKYGILNRMVYESKTGYIYGFFLYCGNIKSPSALTRASLPEYASLLKSELTARLQRNTERIPPSGVPLRTIL